jgi:hypothetical protein
MLEFFDKELQTQRRVLSNGIVFRPSLNNIGQLLSVKFTRIFGLREGQTNAGH